MLEEVLAEKRAKEAEYKSKMKLTIWRRPSEAQREALDRFKKDKQEIKNLIDERRKEMRAAK